MSFFTLPSSEDRAINYLNEYYGKHHLILTFFPAASHLPEQARWEGPITGTFTSTTVITPGSRVSVLMM